ncbi:MAG: hypothetical protein ACHQAX_09200 [Gammaproteobacteria bacterium]
MKKPTDRKKDQAGPKNSKNDTTSKTVIHVQFAVFMGNRSVLALELAKDLKLRLTQEEIPGGVRLSGAGAYFNPLEFKYISCKCVPLEELPKKLVKNLKNYIFKENAPCDMRPLIEHLRENLIEMTIEEGVTVTYMKGDPDFERWLTEMSMDLIKHGSTVHQATDIKKS